MKRNILSILMLFMCYFIVGCNTKYDCEKEGHKWLDATYNAPRTCVYCGEHIGDPKIIPTPIEINEEFQVEIDNAWGGKFGYSEGYTNYGVFNGYLILLNPYLIFNVPNDYMIEDVIFRYSHEFDIYAYKNGKFINIIDCYKWGLLDIEDIRIIGQYHKEYYKNMFKSDQSFDQMYDNIETIKYIYNEKDEIQYNPELSQSEKTVINDQLGYELEYDKYYGEFNKCKVFLKTNDQNESNNYLLGNTVFRYSCGFEINVFRNEKLYTLKDAFMSGILSFYDIDKIGMIHYYYVLSNTEVSDINEFEKEYNDKWTLDYFIDSNGNLIDVIDKKVFEEFQDNFEFVIKNSEYYGFYNGYHLIFTENEWGIQKVLMFDSIIIGYSNYWDIMCYKDGYYTKIEDLYLEGILTIQDLINIQFYHKINVSRQFYIDNKYLRFNEEYLKYASSADVYANSKFLINMGSSRDISYSEDYVKSILLSEIEANLGCEFKYDKYLGSFDNLHIFVVEDKETPYDCHFYGEFMFNNNEPFKIIVYNTENCALYNFKDLYSNNLIDDELVEKFAYLFKLHKRFDAYRGLTYFQFEEQYSSYDKWIKYEK